jgi:hypothetical protein
MLLVKPEGKNHLEDLGVDGRIILNSLVYFHLPTKYSIWVKYNHEIATPDMFQHSCAIFGGWGVLRHIKFKKAEQSMKFLYSYAAFIKMQLKCDYNEMYF